MWGTESGNEMRPIEAWKEGIQVAKIGRKRRNAHAAELHVNFKDFCVGVFFLEKSCKFWLNQKAIRITSAE